MISNPFTIQSCVAFFFFGVDSSLPQKKRDTQVFRIQETNSDKVVENDKVASDYLCLM